ncbi:hypothetical protein RSOLAG22IIIB_01288 [Rhizoctonia solani]|uniref:BTB domain-containing protein n=1 Tax=Rhizoctonia solani TaxID=456999 RepID=A0A0K6G5K1_9AGAM|nr:hypothetical protein RSOLAG22IIIB_01288 [Rhizoctonia solani]
MDNSSETIHAVKEDPTAMVASDIVNNRNSSNATVQPASGPRALRARPSLFALHEPSIILDLTGANIRLQIGNTVIKTHERRLEKFARLRELIKEARQEDAQNDTLTIILDGNKQLVEDFRNMFELINASSIDQADCEVATLVSAARIAAPSAYGYEPLYHYCIDKLEGLSLGPMERVRVARALGNELWEKAACEDLSKRKEPITKEEALTLGLDAYWRIASDREKRKGVTFERMLAGIEDATRVVSAARQRSMPALKRLFICVSLGFWLLYFLLWFNSGTRAVQFLIAIDASNVAII